VGSGLDLADPAGLADRDGLAGFAGLAYLTDSADCAARASTKAKLSRIWVFEHGAFQEGSSSR
jgi:hypothetical protein